MSINKYTRIPIAEDINSVIDLPHTLSYAIGYRMRLNSFNELPKEKRPPRDLWNKPTRLEEFLDHVWDINTDKANSKNYVDIDLEEVE